MQLSLQQSARVTFTSKSQALAWLIAHLLRAGIAHQRPALLFIIFKNFLILLNDILQNHTVYDLIFLNYSYDILKISSSVKKISYKKFFLDIF